MFNSVTNQCLFLGNLKVFLAFPLRCWAKSLFVYLMVRSSQVSVWAAGRVKKVA
jgi:hypothetical protein